MRFRKLNNAAKDGQEVAPLDGRFLPKGPPKQSHKRSLVYDFLYNLYITAGEVLPDSAHSSSNKRPRQGSYKHDGKNLDRTKIRHLPPGKFTDYYRLCTAEFPQEKISKKLFTSAWDPRQTLLYTFQDKHFKTNIWMNQLWIFPFPIWSSATGPVRSGCKTSKTASGSVLHRTMPVVRFVSDTGLLSSVFHKVPDGWLRFNNTNDTYPDNTGIVRSIGAIDPFPEAKLVEEPP